MQSMQMDRHFSERLMRLSFVGLKSENIFS